MSVLTMYDAIQQERQRGFIKYFEHLQEVAADTNFRNGFTEQDLLAEELGRHVKTEKAADALRQARIGLKMALITGELGEALEAVRKNKGADDHIPEFTAEEAEMADVVIRVMNYATDRELRLAEAIVAKNEYNRNRQDHSKEARESAHGKRF